MRRRFHLSSFLRWRVRRTDKVLALCVSFLVGLLLARAQVVLPSWFVILLGIFGFSLSRKPLFHLILLSLFGMCLGIWRGAAYLQALRPYHEFARQKVTLQAKVSQDAVYGASGQLSFEIKKIQFISPKSVAAPGTIKVSGFGELAVYRGDVLEVTGKLYPTRGGKQATMSYTQFKKISSKQSWADTFRRDFIAGLQTALPEPAASFASGLLIGQRNTLPPGIAQAFLMVGLTHIVAVSGYNLTILINAAKRLLEKRSKQLMLVTSLSLISFFLLVTGASASIVRAAVVSGLALAAWYYGRTVRPMVLIMLAAALTAFATPIYFWSDIGWWLSMLAFFGILVVAPFLLTRFSRKGRPSLPVVMIVETLAAEIMTIPLVMFIFGQVSLVALLANTLIVFLIPVAMFLSFIAGLAGMVVPLASGWFAWPAQIILTYMLDMAQLLARLPHVFQTNTYLSIFDMAMCYGLLLVGLLLIQRRRYNWFSELAISKQ